MTTLKAPRVSLDQWRALQAVVDAGGFAQAAERLHRSQSSVSYAVARLQEQLGVQLLEIQGRKAQLTAAGEVLLRRSRQLLGDAAELEQLAHSLEQGWEAEVVLVVDAAYPTATLMAVLKQFAASCPVTRVQLNEVVLSGADEALLEGRADLAIAAQVPAGFLGDRLLEVELIAVAHRDHPLHRSAEPLTSEVLRRELQVVIRDSGLYLKRNIGWLGAEQRWTVSSFETAVAAVSSGLGFGWLPQHQIETELAQGVLLPLPLREGGRQRAPLHLVYGRSEPIGPATQQLAQLFREVSGSGG
jgi:DNA-binding transcriptional LysR family regulator